MIHVYILSQYYQEAELDKYIQRVTAFDCQEPLALLSLEEEEEEKKIGSGLFIIALMLVEILKEEKSYKIVSSLS